MSPSDAQTNEKPTSNLEKNCNQIFIKGPSALTRELLEKMRKSELAVGSEPQTLFGKTVESKQLWILAGLFLLFVFSLTGTILMFFTNTFDNVVFSKLAIRSDGENYEMWRKPTPIPYLNVHLFNYTNVDEFESGDADKLNVKDVGPYVYEMSLERRNVQFNKNLVSYQEHRTYRFNAELSYPRKQNDQFNVLNVPMLTAAAMNKHASFITRIGLSSLLNGLDAKPFLNMAADRFIMGYEDKLYSLSKSVMKLQNQSPSDQFGLVSGSIGLSKEVYTIDSGIDNIDKVTMLDNVNGAKKLDHWSTEACNKINGATDGTVYSPKSIRNKRPVRFYMKDMCRTLPLEFEKEVKILNNKIPAYRYKLNDNAFDSAHNTPEMQCFCNMDSGECPQQGLFNATPCAFGAPIYLSFPHFHHGDPQLLEDITGLDPANVPYESYADIHPTLGFVMAGKNRFQVNIKIATSFGMAQLNRFKDGVVLPLGWFEVALEDKTLPADMVGLIFQTTFTLKTVELALKYGCLLMALVTFCCMSIVVRNRWWASRERTSSLRPLHV